MLISLLVPFREDSSQTRARTWHWLEAYWRAHLPEAEIVVGTDDGVPFSKSVAINDAASRATGRIFVLLDSDSYLQPETIRSCARRIDDATKPIWVLPHARAYRLTQESSEVVLTSDPAGDPPFPLPANRHRTDIARHDGFGRVEGIGDDPFEDYIENAPGFAQILSRRAFTKVGGMDPRFRGWGGEDSSFVRAVDTLYGGHVRLNNFVLHLWHERPGRGSSKTRRWDGQPFDGARSSRPLIRAYRSANNDPIAMRALVDEGLAGP